MLILSKERLIAAYDAGKMHERLPLLCQDLYFKYCNSFNNEMFELFYYSTLPVFYSFAIEKCHEYSCRTDPKEIVNRLYGILISHAAAKHRVPIRVLFSWCFGVLTNLVREERRLQTKNLLNYKDVLMEMRDEANDPLKSMINQEEMENKRRQYLKILKLLSAPNAVLTERERKIMAAFYCRAKPLKTIALEQNITPEHAGVVLYRARRRLASFFRRMSFAKN